LVAFYNINPITALKGVNLLADEGIVFKKRGIGMFVSPDAPEILRRKYRRIFYDEYVIRMAIRASQLGIDLAELKEMLNNAWENNNAWGKGENSGEN
jgi:DNA-binding transcriptional regulator YhcF (GntR family)